MPLKDDIIQALEAVHDPHVPVSLRRMGMLRDNHCGNLIINFKIDYPLKLSDNQIKELSDIL